MSIDLLLPNNRNTDKSKMKIIITALFLTICGMVLLLATVDLEPYLAPKLPQPQEIVVGLTKNAPEDKDTAAAPNEDLHNITILPEIEHKLDLESENLPPQENPAPQEENTPETEITEQSLDSKDTNNQVVETDPEIIPLPEGEYPFSILLETFNEEVSARKAIPRFREQGVSSYWVKVDLGNKRIKYRLFTGVFSTTSMAQHYLDQHNLKNKPIKPTLYSALVGVYPDKDQLDDAYRQTSNAGVVPYSLETETGLYFLYVGAFYTYLGATAQCLDLTAAGLNCKPVKRSTLPQQQ